MITPRKKTFGELLDLVLPTAEYARMEQVVYTTSTEIVCKFCGSNNVVKDGVRNGVQSYWCKACNRKFAGNNALPGMRVPPERIATAVSLFYEGLSLAEIQRSLAQMYNFKPSASTVYEWVVRFTKLAIVRVVGIKANTGTIWAVDETVLDVGGGQVKKSTPNTIYFWDVIDEETRFLLASHFSRSRTTWDARTLFTQAAQRSYTFPRHIVTDRLQAYLDGIEQVFGSETIHVQSEGMASATHNNVIERFHGTLKQRTKVMRGLKNPTTAKLILDGWLVQYNFFRPHEGLRGKTPAQAAGVAFPTTTWKELIEEGYHKSDTGLST